MGFADSYQDDEPEEPTVEHTDRVTEEIIRDWEAEK